MSDKMENFQQVFLPELENGQSIESQNPISVTFQKKVTQKLTFRQFSDKYLDVAFKTSDNQILQASKVILALHSKVIIMQKLLSEKENLF